jgi:hypothetical protein
MTAHDGLIMEYNRETPIQPSFLAAGSRLHAAISARVRHIRLPAQRDPK